MAQGNRLQKDASPSGVRASKDAQPYKTYLLKLTASVTGYLARLDALMREPSTPERGRQIAELSNALQLANDQARYFGLGVDDRTDRQGGRR